MAEPPAQAPAEPAAAPHDTLLATKLHVPGPGTALVARPRLARLLRDGLGRGLVLVCAPAGYGKTVLLAGLAGGGQPPLAWLSLDSGDNDPARFWRHVVAALDQACPGTGERLRPLLGPPAPVSFEALISALINELAGGPGPPRPGAAGAVLVLDDYHVITAGAVHAAVEFLVEHRPPGLRLVLASRSDPPLPLARLRVRGQLAELRAADLRFTSGEAGSLLRQAAGAPGPVLPDDVVAALAARTEGWAAGLQLAALSLRGRADAASFVTAFTGSHRYILDFLAEEVLEQQSAGLRDFLLATSVLERLSGPLCDAVTGQAGSQHLLEEAERAGLFLVPMDEVRGWWRYHHLFADLLRARLGQQPGRAAGLHRRAAEWCAANGLADDAVRHAMAAGDTAWAARLIEQHFDLVYNLLGETVTPQRWLAELPRDVLRSRPRLLLAQALMLATSGRLPEVEELLDAAERALPGSAGEPFEPSAGRAGSMLVNVPALIALHRSYLAQLRGDARATAAFAAATLAATQPDEWLLRSNVQGFLAVAEWLNGGLDRAEQAFTASIAGWEQAGQLAQYAWAISQLSQVLRARGRLDQAARLATQVTGKAWAPGQRPVAAEGAAQVALAELAWQRNDLAVAGRHATEGIALSRQFAYTGPLAAGLVTLAWIRQAQGDPGAAAAAMDEAAQAAPGPAGLLNQVPAQRARLALAQGNVPAAERWVAERGLSPGDEPDYPKEPGHLVLARVLLATGQPGPALALLDRLLPAAEAQQRAGSVIELRALRALALAAAGEESAAQAELAAALALGRPQGYIRVFADEGEPMAALLARLVAARRAGPAPRSGQPGRVQPAIPAGYLARLQAALQPGPGPAGGSGTPAGTSLAEPLTPRELQVLAMLADGLSNQAIARQLVVSLDTVKKHVSHLLAKLGAANRTEAVARARELGLTG
jgi:LuxR family maltose regulon positive regulatory protein